MSKKQRSAGRAMEVIGIIACIYGSIAVLIAVYHYWQAQYGDLTTVAQYHEHMEGYRVNVMGIISIPVGIVLTRVGGYIQKRATTVVE